MSKIEEMANSTYFLRQHSGWFTDEEFGDVEYGIKVRREAFVKGANYVLEEIEKLTNNQNWCAFPKQSHKELKELITKLKDE